MIGQKTLNKVTEDLRLEDGERVIVIRKDGTVELSEIEYNITGKPSLNNHVLATRYELSTSSWKEFSKESSSEVLKDVLHQLEQRTQARVIEQKVPIFRKIASKIRDTICQHIQTRNSEEASDRIMSNNRAMIVGKVNELLDNVKDMVVARFRSEIVQRNVAEQIMGKIDRFDSGFKKELESQFGNNEKADLGLLPSGIRYMKTHHDRTIVVIEQPPQTRTVHFSEEFLKESTKAVDERLDSNELSTDRLLSFPYMIFVIYFDGACECSVSVFYSKKPINSLKDPLFHTNLPNCDIGTKGDVCMGSEFSPRGDNLLENIDHAISHFWRSEFNTDITEGYYKVAKGAEKDSYRIIPRDERLKTVQKWEKASKENPLFVLDVDWINASMTMKDATEIYLDTLYEDDSVDEFDEQLEDAMSILEEIITQTLEETTDPIEVGSFFSRSIRGELIKLLNQLNQESANWIIALLKDDKLFESRTCDEEFLALIQDLDETNKRCIIEMVRNFKNNLDHSRNRRGSLRGFVEDLSDNTE